MDGHVATCAPRPRSAVHTTPNRKFIVKTVTKAEQRALIRISRDYLAHCEEHPETLVQYLGCHSIRLPLNTSKIYVVVMRNILPGRQYRATFDLKGATANRQRARGKELEALVSGQAPLSAFKTLLDKDWMALGIRLKLSDEHTRRLQRVIAADADFLASKQLMDYSLLLGIAGASADGTAPQGALLRGAEGEVYYLGLIDILETWRARWHVQNLVLRFFFRYVVCMQWYNPDGITAIPPGEYAARFQEFTRDQLLRLPGGGEAVGKSWQPWW